jgi:transposase
MDNARTHHYKELVNEINDKYATTNNRIVYNVPYSPETNPIEYINNKIKHDLKSKSLKSISNLQNELDIVLKNVSAKCLKNCFRKSIELLDA